MNTKLKHWCGFPAIFAREAAPVLWFGFFPLAAGLRIAQTEPPTIGQRVSAKAATSSEPAAIKRHSRQETI